MMKKLKKTLIFNSMVSFVKYKWVVTILIHNQIIHVIDILITVIYRLDRLPHQHLYLTKDTIELKINVFFSFFLSFSCLLQFHFF
jgi:hypothetical protein